MKVSLDNEPPAVATAVDWAVCRGRFYLNPGKNSAIVQFIGLPDLLMLLSSPVHSSYPTLIWPLFLVYLESVQQRLTREQVLPLQTA